MENELDLLTVSSISQAGARAVACLRGILSPIREEHTRGFTLLELITILAIVGILSSIAIPNYYSYIDKARNTKAIADLRLLEREILTYYAVNETYPESLADIERDALPDPWGNPY